MYTHQFLYIYIMLVYVFIYNLIHIFGNKFIRRIFAVTSLENSLTWKKLHGYIEQLFNLINLPSSFCHQVVKNSLTSTYIGLGCWSFPNFLFNSSKESLVSWITFLIFLIWNEEKKSNIKQKQKKHIHFKVLFLH